MSFVSAEELRYSQVLFDLGLWAEKNFGKLIYDYYTEHMQHIPLVEERVIDMPIGGIDDMAVWASFIWERIARWFDEGPPPSPSPRVSLAMPVGEDSPLDEGDIWIHRLVRDLVPLRPRAEHLMSLEGVQDLFQLLPSTSSMGELRLLYHPTLSKEIEPYMDDLQLVIQALLDSLPKPKGVPKMLQLILRTEESDAIMIGTPKEATAAPKRLSIQEGMAPIAYHGRDLAACDLDADGVPEVIKGAYGMGSPGAPQVGTVMVDYKDGSEVLLTGNMTHGRFGWSLACLDYNLDGVQDLVVGAPASSWSQGEDPAPDSEPIHREWGKVFVYFGQKGAPMRQKPDFVIEAIVDLTYLGDTLATGDIDGDGKPDLLLGAPFSSQTPSDYLINNGLVAGFISSSKRLSGSRLNCTEAELYIRGDAYSWFGASIVVVEPFKNQGRQLFVGAPGHRKNACKSGANCTVGAVYVYDILSMSGGKLNLTQVGLWQGEEGLAEFGHAMALQPSMASNLPRFVAVSSPAAGSTNSATKTQTRGGEVRLFSLGSPPQGVVSLSEAPVHAIIAGTTDSLKGSRLGYHLSFQTLYDGEEAFLLIGAPLARDGLFGLKREVGRLLAYTGGLDLPNGTIIDPVKAARWTLTGEKRGGRFGFSTAVDGKGHLAVGAHHSAGGVGDMAGAVITFEL